MGEPPTYLQEINTHPRDEFITFEEGPHIYTVNGERGTYTSVTTWNHSHFSKFESDKIIGRILKSSRWDSDPDYKYYRQSAEDIKTMWEKNRDSSAGSGTKMHYDIECFYNNMNVKNDSIEYQYFMKFHEDYKNLKPYRTEWMVFHEELKLSGSIDMIFENPDGTLQIYDWKRCKSIEHESLYGKYATTECISHFPDTNYWHYTLQLNIYRRILEEKYGKVVTDLYLVCLHPDNQYKTYDRILVQKIDKEIDALFELRRKQIETDKK
jgi:hypothetical protein